MFRYQGPATIDGVDYPRVKLEEYSDGRLRGWEGVAVVPVHSQPAGFSPDLGGRDNETISLPDGRQGKLLRRQVRFDGNNWVIEVVGTGPPPA